MSTLQQKQFMVACGQTVTVLNYTQAQLYIELIREEVVRELFPAFDKFIQAQTHDNTVELLDAIGDSKVVIDGLALSLGIDPEIIKARVDVSNLSKIPDGDSKVLKREDGKILKPNSFMLPYLDDLANRINKPYNYAGLIDQKNETQNGNLPSQVQGKPQ
jgi:predicted HAD superfamily Cof-like phosphohydrolase